VKPVIQAMWQDLPTSSKEWAIACILATNFHTEPVIDSRFEVGINPILKDLVINRRVVKTKRTKRQKREVIVEATESVGENQPV
jgi:hypothetical protein